MWKLLQRPYPFNDDVKHNAKIIFFISIGVLLFLLLFQPIDYSAYNNIDIFYLITGLAASTFLTLSLNLIILPSLFPNQFFQNRWTILKEILWNVWILITISFSDFLYYTKLFGVIHINFNIVGMLLLLGVLPVCVLIIINQDRLLRSHLKSAQKLNYRLAETKLPKERFINFLSDYQKDHLKIKPDALMLIRSADNYIEVFYKIDGNVKNQMIRSTLKKANEATRDFDFIVKCHRTYIVNINYISEIKGSSQGYGLHFENLDFSALVSQKYIKDFDKIIK